MDNLEAYKMDGLGNDFIIFDRRKISFSLTREQISKIADRCKTRWNNELSTY